MSKPPAPSRLPDMDAMMALVQTFETHAAKVPALTGAKLDDLIRIVPGNRGIFAGQLDGQEAVYRFYIADPEKLSTRDWGEIQRAYEHMASGDYRVAKPLYHDADLGLVVVARVAGKPLLQHIWQSEPGDRAAYLRPAAEWLRKYTARTEYRVSARLAGWFEKAEAVQKRQAHRGLRRLRAAILGEARRIAAPHDGAPWRLAICHGDFHPNNLLVDGPRVTGIDTGGSAKLPICKDMARFLVHMGRRGLIPSEHPFLGIDRVGFDAFVQAFDLNDTERDVWLPVMIGVEAVMRAEGQGTPRSRIRRARGFYEALLEGLKALP